MVGRSLSPSRWQARQAAHEARVDEATAAHRGRLRTRLLEVCAAALAQRGSTPATSSP